MGNCIKRETGYEIEESDQDKMKKILANIVTH